MSTTDQLSRIFARVLILFAVLVVCFAGSVALAHLGIMSAEHALMIGVTMIVALYIIQRQFEISRDVRQMKVQAFEVGEYEDDINRRIEALAQKVTALEASTKTPVDYSEDLARLTSRMNQLEFDTKTDMDNYSSRFDAGTGNVDGQDCSDLSPRSSGESQDQISSATEDKQDLITLMQPIVELPTRQPIFYDAFMQPVSLAGGTGDLDDFRRNAEANNKMPTIDKRAFFNAVRMVRKLRAMDQHVGVFCRISPRTLGLLRVFREISGFVEANAVLHDSLVFELSQEEFLRLNKRQSGRLIELVDRNISLSMTNTTDLNLNPANLLRSGFRYVKVPAQTLLGAAVKSTQQGIHPSSLPSILQVEGMRLIATDVETDREAISLIDMDVSLAQGPLFASPRPVKADLLDSGEKASGKRRRPHV